MTDKFNFLYDDHLSISFTDRNKAHYKLSRTRTQIKCSNTISDISPCHWIFNSMGGKEGVWEILWHEDEGHYRIVSTSNVPFYHNATLSLESVIRRGDFVNLGYTRIDFYGEKKVDETSSIPVPWSFWEEGSVILLNGDTGTGKTSLAKKIHKELHCELKPFVHVNLSSFSKNLIESELFGHEEGAFTGALKRKKGAVELADNGTLFIDEVDSVDKEIQVKLLTFLDDLKFRRVGGEKVVKANCRIIFASGSCLKNKVDTGEMRLDFYFRLMSGLFYRLQSLKENPSIILKSISDFEKKYFVTVNSKLKDYLLECPWPGNFRQLQSYLNHKRLTEVRDGQLIFGDLESDLKNSFASKDVEFDNVITLKEMRKEYCEKVFHKYCGSVSETSRTLGISRNTLKSILAS